MHGMLRVRRVLVNPSLPKQTRARFSMGVISVRVYHGGTTESVDGIATLPEHSAVRIICMKLAWNFKILHAR